MVKATGTILSDINDAWRAQDLEWLASYLPDDFCHVMHIPTEIHPLGETRCGKKVALERWSVVVLQYEFLRFDTSDLMTETNRAAIEIPLQYRHRETGTLLETTKANFWTLEEGWPVKLTEYYDIGYIQAFAASVAPRAPA
jgi:hypothetical protein